MADPYNALVPFEEFGKFHFARFVIIDDKTLKDFALAGLPVPEYPDHARVHRRLRRRCRSSVSPILVDNATAAAGLAQDLRPLRRVRCSDRSARLDEAALASRRQRPTSTGSAAPCCRCTRRRSCARRCRRSWQQYVKDHPDAGDDVRGVRDHLVRFAHENPDLMPAEAPTPIGWWMRNWLHFAIVPVLLVASLAVRDRRPRSVLPLAAGF